ncbi:hypothetical protein ACJX0J_035063, partial [Zea mays]
AHSILFYFRGKTYFPQWTTISKWQCTRMPYQMGMAGIVHMWKPKDKEETNSRQKRCNFDEF